MVASFLPLPSPPDAVHDLTPSQMDVERQLASQAGPIDDRSHQKATWWRNLNRIMSAIGTLLIGVIVSLMMPIRFCGHHTNLLVQIALGILASRMA